MDFQVIDISTSFNLLLVRPWIHGLDDVTFSLNQKVKFISDENKVFELCGDSWIRSTKRSSSALVLEVQLLEHWVTNIQGFEFVKMTNNELPIEYLLSYFDKCTNPMVASIMKKMKYFSVMGLGRKL